MLVEFLAQLTSVERILEYTKVETETNLFEGREYERITKTWTFITKKGLKPDYVRTFGKIIVAYITQTITIINICLYLYK